MNNEDFTELEQQEIQEQMQGARIQNAFRKIGSDFAQGFRSGMNANNPDVKAIQERISKNGDFGMTNKNKDDEKKRNKDTGELDDKKKKSELDDGSSSEEKDKDNEKEDNKSEESDKNENKDDDSKKKEKKKEDTVVPDDEDGDDGELAKKALKIKITLIVFGIALLVFIIICFAVVVVSYFEAELGSLTNLFGVPETTIEEDGATRSGLLTEDEYLYDSNGNPLTNEALVAKLKSEQECKVTVWNTIGDAIFGGQRFKDRCSLMREIQRQTEGTDVDKNLIVSTLFYGYDTLPSKDQYQQGSVPDTYLDSSDHYLSLEQILSDKNMGITKSTITSIIKNAKIVRREYYYDWTIEDETNSNGEVTAKVGTCEKKYLPETSSYDLTKWKVFMRFGEPAAEAYEKEMTTGKSYSASSDECKGIYSESELLEKVKNAPLSDGTDAGNISYRVSSSVSAANEDLKTYKDVNITPLLQKADIESPTPDSFSSYNGMELSYRNGFAYNNFPGYKKAFDDPNIDLKEDSTFTPKEIEKTIQNIISKKIDMNRSIGEYDSDATDTFSDTDGNLTSVITGAYCGNYLTAKLSEIKVKLTDCHGNFLRVVPFDDYIIGVANAEVSNKNDDYVLSEMLAAISYALHRRNNYTKGTVIQMKSGTCDQAYCSMMEGCHTQANPEICSGCSSFYIGGSKGKNPGLYAKYKALYERAADFLVVSNGKVHNCHYVSTIQNEWYRKAQAGMSFTQIIAETYKDEGAQVIRCSDADSPTTPTTPTEPTTPMRIGATATTEYPKVSPDLGKFYGYSYADGSDNSIKINPEWKNANLVTISPECSDSSFANMSFTVHKEAADNFKKAFKKVCTLITTGVKLSNGTTCKYSIDNLHEGTTFIERKTTNGAIDPHSYGISQDWNYSATYKVGNETFSPYSSRSLEEYEKFVLALGGNEEHCTNVNYILWKYAYKDAGFIWGGNLGRKGNSGTFDGKLFQISY
ncbi:MAG: hypothetical protein IKR57_06250 [Bacilli bacterium]|nr:hypothetical protein [Bacilli bacterium]